jgi:hypothetical protein
MIVIGIDTGTNTGIAAWNTALKCFDFVDTMTIDKAFSKVLEYKSGDEIFVFFEDPKHIGGRRERAQGAGSVKRDAAIWERFLKNNKIPYRSVRAGSTITKMKGEYFKQLTGWTGRTSEHARDAAMMVYDLTEEMVKAWGNM